MVKVRICYTGNELDGWRQDVTAGTMREFEEAYLSFLRGLDKSDKLNSLDNWIKDASKESADRIVREKIRDNVLGFYHKALPLPVMEENNPPELIFGLGGSVGEFIYGVKSLTPNEIKKYLP